MDVYKAFKKKNKKKPYPKVTKGKKEVLLRIHSFIKDEVQGEKSRNKSSLSGVK